MVHAAGSPVDSHHSMASRARHLGLILSAPAPRCLSLYPLERAKRTGYRLWNWFTSVDTDRSGAIAGNELERAVNGNQALVRLR
ncbi:hypothetical protein B0H19DRAFT_9008 [Mycena capillaripes]|nr:hypothetical protein B0H19DRAFT_9008 [Mycena capillaripes]